MNSRRSPYYTQPSWPAAIAADERRSPGHRRPLQIRASLLLRGRMLSVTAARTLDMSPIDNVAMSARTESEP